MDIKQLFESANLSEDTLTKIEEAIGQKVSDEVEAKTKEITESAEKEAEEKYAALAESYSEYLKTYFEDKADQYISEEVLPEMDKYLTHVVESFCEENKELVESKSKVALADAFLKNISESAAQFNVVVPVEEKSEIAELTSKIDEANKQIEDLLDSKNKVNESLNEMKKEKIISTLTEGMTETHKEKFVSRVNDIVFTTEEQFEESAKVALANFNPESVPKEQPKQIQESLQDEDTSPYLSGLFKSL